MVVEIHPTALIDPAAQLADGVFVGPYSVLGPNVKIGAETRLQSHVVVQGHTTIGTGNVVYPFVSLGQPSPDRKYKGEVAYLEIGDENDIREYVNIHIGTGADKGTTRIGSRNLMMAMVHVAHDCVVGDDCIFANGAQLAGHVEVADHAVIGGLTGLHQHVRVGQHAIIGGHTGVDKDVPPYASVTGRRARLSGVNLVGLRRHGFEKEVIKTLQDAFDDLFFDETGRTVPMGERVTAMIEAADDPRVLEVLQFIQASNRGTTLPEVL